MADLYGADRADRAGRVTGGAHVQFIHVSSVFGMRKIAKQSLFQLIRSAKSSCNRWSVALTLALGLAATLAVVIFMWRSDQQKIAAEQSARVDSRITTISAELRRYEDLVTAVQSYAEASGGRIDIDVYQALASHLLRGREGVQTLNYSPRVRASEREAFQATARREGLGDFQITEIGPDGRLRTATVRDQYFPVYNSYPVEGNEAALGLDAMAAQEPLFSLARDSGKIVASAPVRLVTHEDHWGFLLIGPVYETRDATTVDDRRAKIAGYVTSIFRIGEMFESILRNSTNVRGYDHYIFDGPPDRLGALLYVHPSRLRQAGELPRSFGRIRSADEYVHHVIFDGREWTIFTVPLATWQSTLPELDVTVALLLGLVGTGIGTLYVMSTRRHTNFLNQVARFDSLTGFGQSRRLC